MWSFLAFYFGGFAFAMSYVARGRGHWRLLLDGTPRSWGDLVGCAPTELWSVELWSRLLFTALAIDAGAPYPCGMGVPSMGVAPPIGANYVGTLYRDWAHCLVRPTNRALQLTVPTTESPDSGQVLCLPADHVPRCTVQRGVDEAQRNIPPGEPNSCL